MNSYRVYGITMHSSRELTAPLPSGSGRPDVTVSWATTSGGGDDPGEVLFVHRYLTEDLIVLRRTATGLRLWFSGAGEFDIDRDQITVRAEGDGRRAEVQLLGAVMAVWLETSGILVLHASAVSMNGDAVVLLGAGRAGKTSLATHLLGLGASLLTDDLLAVRSVDGAFEAAPGYPQIRLWPAEADRLIGGHHSLELAHPDFDKRILPLQGAGLGEFDPSGRAIKSIYVLDPSAPPECAPTTLVGDQVAVMELIRHSFAGLFLPAMGLQAQRLAAFAEMIEKLPMMRVATRRDAASVAIAAEAILENALASADTTRAD